MGWKRLQNQHPWNGLFFMVGLKWSNMSLFNVEGF